MKRKLCNGFYTEDVIQVLRAAHSKGDTVSLHQPCGKCGRVVQAENKAGKWLPRTHYAHQPPKSTKRGAKRF